MQNNNSKTSNKSSGTKCITLRGQKLLLSPDRTILWKEQAILFIADAHIGKVSHFRKNGIGLPSSAITNQLHRIQTILDTNEVETVLFLGDLFHSEVNFETGYLAQFIKRNNHVAFELVPGNHDRFHADVVIPGLTIRKIGYTIGPFSFYHEPEEIPAEATTYGMCGHLHPGVSTYLGAGEYKTLPCFSFTKNYVVLPAFCHFAGYYRVKKEHKKLFPIAGDRVFEYAH